MKGLHMVNGMTWAANACLWMLYAHSPVGCFVSTIVCGASFYYAWRNDY